MNRLAVANELVRIAEDLTADAWYDMPEGWDAGSREQFWDSLTGDTTHKITKCIKEMTGKVSDPGAFCGALAARVGYR